MKSLALALCAFPWFALAAPPDAKPAMAKAAAYLRQHQKEDGSFANPANDQPSKDHPALTALPLQALQRMGDTPAEVLAKGYAFLRRHVQPDGSIYAKGLSNYNTSICLVTFLGANLPEDEPLIRHARAFVAAQQASNMADPALNGGFGYGPTGASPKRQHPDLDNTLFSLQALAAYAKARPTAEAAKGGDLNWQAAINFISRCQNLPETNSQPWASGDPENRGGAVYHPNFSNAGEQVLPDGKKALRSYGTMSYAALLSFIYADLPRGDARVQAAVEWLGKHYTLTENPGLGDMGLYYYYHLAARGLDAAGVQELATANGEKVDWRTELTQKLLSLQRPDGSWVNTNARWMETDPVLVTTYCLLALQTLTQP